jgi:GAF domain-containing protein
MVSGLPEWLLTELNAIEDVKLRNRLAAGLQIAIYETVRDLLDKLSAVRHLMLYFNTYADWDTVLDSIRQMMRADAVQVVRFQEVNKLAFHLLPHEQTIEDDFIVLLAEGRAIDERHSGVRARLGALLAINNDLLGMLLLIRNRDEPFTDYDRTVLANLASEMAVAINSLDLYSLLQDQAEYLSALVKSTYKGS